MPRICRTRLRTTVATTARLSVRPVADRVSATREVLGLIRVQPVENSSERVLLRGAPCRHSTTVTGDDITRPGPAGAENDAARFKPTDPNSLPRRLFNLLSTKKTKRTLCSARMLQACLNNIERKTWYTDAKMSTEFLTKHLWLSTNVWLISRRLLREGNDGKKIQELLFDELWREAIRQMRSIDVDDLMIRKYLKQAQQHTLGTLCQYDHAYSLEDREERLDALSGALWRGIYSRNTRLDEELVRLMAEHVDSELSDVYALDEDALFGGCIDFGLPSPEIMNLNAAQGGKPTHSTMTKDRPAKVPPMDPDLGDDNKGRWRASLAESGKVYYWHTVTNEATYENPEGVEYVAATMPVQENAKGAKEAKA